MLGGLYDRLFLLGGIMKRFSDCIGELCGMFRKHKLHKTLKEVSHETGVSVATLSAFENGRSSNANLLECYLVSCETKEDVRYLTTLFMSLFTDVYGG